MLLLSKLKEDFQGLKVTLDLQELGETTVFQGYQVHQECQDIQEGTDKKEKKEVQVNMVQKDSGEEMVSLDLVESLGPQEPERRVKGVVLAFLVSLVHLGQKALVVYMVNKALKASEESLVLLGQKVIEDFLVYLELKVIMAIEERMGCQAFLEL